tara:strand:- start:191 stop:751 length:561 start_codon:yes stop_codon:yes gene_type:complete
MGNQLGYRRTGVVRILVTALMTSGILRLWHQADLAVTCKDRDHLFVANSSSSDLDRYAWAVRAQAQPWMWSNWWVPLLQGTLLALWATDAESVQKGRTRLYVTSMVIIGVVGNWNLLHGVCRTSSICKDARFHLAANNCNYPADGLVYMRVDNADTACTVCDDVLYTMSLFGAVATALSVMTVLFS